MKRKLTATSYLRITYAFLALILFILLSAQLRAQPCNAHFTYTPGDTINSVFFFPNPNSPTTIYSWNFGDGDTSTAGFNRHIYPSIGTYYVCLTVKDSTNKGVCTDTYCDSVHVVPIPPPVCNAHFTSVQDSINSIHFVASLNLPGSQYKWNFGDGDTSTSNNPRHIYASTGTYYVCLTVTDSTSSGTCTDTQCDSIHVVPPPPPVCNAHFTFLPDSINSFNFIAALNPPGSQYLWNFGDGDTSTTTNPRHVYASTGTYYVCLTVSDSTSSGKCTDTQCDSVHVVPPPPPFCNGHFTFFADSINSIRFSAAVNPSGSQYLWNFGDGDTSTTTNPRHIYASAGTYYVCLTVSDSSSNGKCTDTQCDSVHVSTPPPLVCNAHFTFNSGNPHDTLKIMFHPSFNPAGSHYSWTFGDGNTSNAINPSHTYASAGTYYVCLTVTDTTSSGTCTDTQCDSVKVNPKTHPGNPSHSSHCNANFIRQQGDSLKVSFSHALNPANGSYLWYFGDGDSSTLANPTHMYAQPGNYNVCLTVTRPNPDSCSSTFCSKVNVTGNGHGNKRMDVNLDGSASIEVFPNPMTAGIGATVSVMNISNPVTFKMYDMTGRLIFTKSNVKEGNFTITGNNITPGLYFYLVNNENDVISSGRVIVQ